MANPSQSLMPRIFLFLFRVVLAFWILTGPWDENRGADTGAPRSPHRVD